MSSGAREAWDELEEQDAARAAAQGKGVAGTLQDIPPGYEELARVLDMALQQASRGKGQERHAGSGEPFHEQQIVQLGLWLGSADFEIGQVCKKALEAQRLPHERAVAELLGVIVYASAAVLVLERLPTAKAPPAAANGPSMQEIVEVAERMPVVTTAYGRDHGYREWTANGRTVRLHRHTLGWSIACGDVTTHTRELPRVPVLVREALEGR